jgi:hypothetical protein
MLFFANASSVRDGILQAVAEVESPCSVVLLDLSLTPEVDVPVVEMLEGLHGRLADQDVELWVSHIRALARETLERAGVLEAIGTDHIYPRTSDGILAFVLRAPGAEERIAVIDDVLIFVRERRARPGTTVEAVEVLDALERRLVLELDAAAGAGVGPSPRQDSTTGRG